MKRNLVVSLAVLLLVAYVALGAVVNAKYTTSVGAAIDTAVKTNLNLQRDWVAFQLALTIPDTTNGVTFTVSLTDASDRVLKSYAGVADNQTIVFKPVTVVGPGYKLSILPSAVTGNAIVITTVIGYSD